MTTQPLTSAKKRDYIPTLDGLRAVAILLVILSHTVGHTEHPRIAELGHLGVRIFFALSGYLITTRLLEEYSSTGKISLRNFYLRRIFRILPPALFYLGVVGLLAWAGIVICSWSAIRAAILLYINYSEQTALGWKVEHFWSLSVEEHFYLFWPCLLILFGVRKGWRTAVAIAVSICVWRVLDNRFNFVSNIFHAPYLAASSLRTDLTADALLWGCCLAFLLRSPMRVRIGPAISTIVAIVVVILLEIPFFLGVNHFVIFLNFFPTVLLGVILVSPTAPIGRFLELSPVKFVGKLSYSLYIWQQLFLGGLNFNPPIILALLAIPTCAYLSYRLIEQPSIQFGKRLLARNALAAPR